MPSTENKNIQLSLFSRELKRPASHLYFAIIMLILIHDEVEVGVALVGIYLFRLAREISRDRETETLKAFQKELKCHGLSGRTLYAAVPIIGAILAVALLTHEIASIYFL